ncbi:MAG: T9SS type A sorting domain-containing protein, partial [Bacteroidales bacterium]|nr:T9SS type A sorting domain-containing protein [Bacteroidales bacterium]
MRLTGRRIFTILLMTMVTVASGFRSSAKDIIVEGTVTDEAGALLMNTRVSFFLNAREYSYVTGSDGKYSVRISGTYSDVPGEFQAGKAYPVPFTWSVNIPFIINSDGDLTFTVYNVSGQKIRVMHFNAVAAGSYNLVWDGCSQNGSPQRPGFYLYAITFKGKTYAGRVIKGTGTSTFSAPSGLDPVMMPPQPPVTDQAVRFSVITEVTRSGYYPVRLTDITVVKDTIIDFVLAQQQSLPFKVSGDYIARYENAGYRSMILKGINLGSSPPGYFPGEIAYAITPETYERWIEGIGEAGFNTLRVYTLHPPVFYEKLAEYNQRHPDNPLLLFQGIWLEEVEDAHDPAAYDLLNRRPSFGGEIEEVVNSINGNSNIPFRYGKAYGIYKTDISRWTAGYIIGREVAPQEVDSTNKYHPSVSSFTGTRFSITGGSATEAFVTEMLDKVVTYESTAYAVTRPVSFSSWPTLDPLEHPTEIYTDEDVASFDITKINGATQSAGLFASYHAYPYYPNFISQQPDYQTYSDADGHNSYLGYITAMKNHYSGIPLVIGEFGVPSSWGSAHQSFSEMHHGSYSEIQQGDRNLRMMNNILDAGCAGGFMFAWMDEWFKRTWIVLYLEAYGIESGSEIIPTRQLWHNETSPEQCFGLLAFDQKESDPFVTYSLDVASGPVTSVSATHDEGFFYLDVNTAGTLTEDDELMIAFDTYLGGTGESQLPDGALVSNRAEFLLTLDLADDTALHHVTAAYDMNGLTVRFNLTDPTVQKYKSTVTNGAPWNLMKWINDGFELTEDEIGRVPIEHASDFSTGNRAAVAWNGNNIKVRLPWTMLYF